MDTSHHFFKRLKKYIKRGFLGTILLVATTLGIFTYALSDSFIRSQVDYLIGVIDANVTAQNLDENSAKNVYMGLRDIYRGVIAVLDERIGDTTVPPQCAVYTDPVERAICESTIGGGGTGSGGTETSCNDITLSNNQIWGGCDILDQVYGNNICPAGYNIPTAGQWSKLIDSFPGTYVAKLSLKKQYYWTSTNSNNAQEKLLLYIKNDVGSDQLIDPGLMTNKLTVRCIRDGSATTSNGQPNPAYTDIPPAPIPYKKNYRKACEGIIFEGTNRIQNFRWYDTDGKPQDLIQKCSQPNRVNGGLICSESANGCCPTGQIAINGTCITPADAGGSCYATSACKDGLSCNNHICVGTATTGSGNNGGGSGTTGTPTVSAMVTGIASTTTPGAFTNKATQGTTIQLQYNSSNVANTLSFKIFKGTGPLDNTNLATGTTYVQYANLPGNTSGTFNIPLQNLAIGTYRIVVTGCNSINQCIPTSGVVFEVIAAGGAGGGTGGGTGGNPTSDETPNDYQPSTVTPPTGFTDTSCQSTQSWSCPGSTSRSNPPTCYVASLNSEVNETDLNNAGALCYPGYGGPRQVMGLKVNASSSTVTWFCTEIKADGTKRSEACGAKLKVNASCGTQAGAPIVRDTFSLKNTPNLCSRGVPVQTYKNNGGTQFEPYYDYIIESDGTKPSSDPLYPSTWKYMYTCGGINGGNDAVCKTGKVMESGVCGNTLTCQTGIPNLTKGTQFNASGIASKTYEVDRYDSKVYWDGEYNWECQGYNGGGTVDCRADSGTKTGYCGTYYGKSLETIKGGTYNMMINRTNQSVPFNSSCSGTFPAGVTCASINYPLDSLCTIPTGFGADPTKLLTIVDDVGTDGTFNWKCASMDKIGNPISPIADCSATRILPGVCGTNNGATLTKIDPASNFSQSWGEPIMLKYCQRGYPNYWESQTEPGKFHWYCYIEGATNTQCVANYTAPTGTPVNGLCSYPSVKNTCMTGNPEVISACTSDEKSTWKCKGVNSGYDSSTCYVNNAGCGTPAPTYSWSFANNPSWGICTGNCGPANGTQTRTAQCLRNDGVLSPGYCNGTAPTEPQACTVSAGSCTPLSCPAGNMTKVSPDTTNTCKFSWQAITGGNTKTVTLSDGSTAQGYCNTDGTWGDWDVTCKNAASAPVTCAGGGRSFTSVDGTNSCYANYEQRNAGSAVSIGNGLTISGGGQGSATCSAGGYWTYSINCPGQTITCPSGVGDLPAVGNDPACLAIYPSTPAGTWGSGTTNLNGGWVKGYCNPDGTWKADSITFDCKNP